MSELTPMQQAIFMNHQISIQTYLTQLSTAISLLPSSVPLAKLPLLGADAFVALEKKPARDSWAHVLPLLETVWGKPGAVRAGHVTRGAQGVLVVAKLLDHVGAATFAGLDDEERDGAIGWIRALRDAVREKITSPTVGGHAAAPPPPQPVAGPSSWAPPPAKGSEPATAKAKGKARARTKPKPTVAQRAPATQKHSLPIASTSNLDGKKPKYTAPPSPGSSLSSLSDSDEPMPDVKPSSLKLTLSHSGTPSLPSHAGTPSLPPVAPAPKHKIARPAAAPRVSSTDRPQRSRKAPAHLDLSSPPRGPSQDGSHFEPGEAVLARFPNYNWWPSVIVDPEEAPEEGVQGTRVEGSYMVKAIPTGGDWRWNPPHHVRALSSTEIDAILSGTQRGPDASTNAPPPAWTKYRADLVEGLLIAQDTDRLREWAKNKTGVELWLEEERERKRQSRIW